MCIRFFLTRSLVFADLFRKIYSVIAMTIIVKTATPNHKVSGLSRNCLY